MGTNWYNKAMGKNTNRRKFMKQTAAAVAGISVFPTLAWSEGHDVAKGSDKILKKLSTLNDKGIPDLLKNQINRPGDFWHGGVVNGYDLPNAHATNNFVIKLGSAYISKFSSHYKSSDLIWRMERAMDSLLKIQHTDGTIDLYSTNFHSTPDTAFLVNYLSPVYVCLRRMEQPGLEGLIAKMETFFQRAGKCLLVGGMHTANHRWVMSSALARLYTFFGDQSYVHRMDAWLAEGIDQDPDGQFTERSVSVYSAVCDTMFLTIGRLLDRPKLMDVVRKNLAMTLYYIQPGGEVLTDASHRQDSAQTGYVNRYYYAYRYFAVLDKNPEYAAVCKLIEEEMPERITSALPMLLEDQIFETSLVRPSKVRDNYFKRFEHSGVFRIRRGPIDISVIEQNPTFFSFRKGTAVMQSMRLASAFFGKGQFVAEEADFDGKVITLKRTLTKGYYQPVPEAQRTGQNDWKKFPRSKRQLSEAQTQTWQVKIKEENGKVSLHITIDGTPHVPVSLELSFREGGQFTGVVADPQLGDSHFLENAMGHYQVGNDEITFGPGTTSHKWAEMRGMLPKQSGNSVYLTGFTPFEHIFEIY